MILLFCNSTICNSQIYGFVIWAPGKIQTSPFSWTEKHCGNWPATLRSSQTTNFFGLPICNFAIYNFATLISAIFPGQIYLTLLNPLSFWFCKLFCFLIRLHFLSFSEFSPSFHLFLCQILTAATTFFQLLSPYVKAQFILRFPRIMLHLLTGANMLRPMSIAYGKSSPVYPRKIRG